MKTALILGSTGLVGSRLLELLLADPRFSSVVAFVRRRTGHSHPKYTEHLIDFEQPDEWRSLVTGDILFSAFGTTLARAGSREAQYRVDHTYQYLFAGAAAANGVKTYVLVSAAGSDPGSRIFYSRMKGELERDISRLPFRNIQILRPGMLAGARSEFRLMEKIGIPIFRLLGSFPGLSQFKPIEAADVARAMIAVSLSDNAGIHIQEAADLFRLGKNKA